MDFCHQFGAPVLRMFGIYSLLILFGVGFCDPSDSSPNKAGSSSMSAHLLGRSSPNIIGCLPCSNKFLAGSYSDNHNSLLDSDFHSLLAQEISSIDLCEGQAGNISMLGLLDLFRQLHGEGSHRLLVSSIRFDIQSNILGWLDDHICEAVLIERLPAGVFADSFELQHLVDRGVFLSAAVFGDTNLELPSALSNRSVVEFHMDIGHIISLKRYETVIQLPLHARYPPLDARGYAVVTIGRPDLFLRCRPKDLLQEASLWMVIDLGAGLGNSVTWRIPCGNEAHANAVSGITFASALVCSLLIVVSTICLSGKNDIKDL